MTDKNNSDNHSPGQDNDPKEVGREAEELQPNQDTQDNRKNIAEDEMGVPGEDKLDASDKQSRPLTRPEDNAKVDRVAPAEQRDEHRETSSEIPAPKARDYLISPRGLRNLFIASNVAGIALIIFILTLASSGPQGRYTPADETQYQRTLLEATETISAAAPNEGADTARIPIDEAIALVAERGLGSVNEALAAPEEGAAPAAAPAEGGAVQADAQDTVAQDTASQDTAAQADTAPPAQAQPQPAQSAQATAPQEAEASQPQTQPAALDLSAGEAVYTTNCASCHQATGQGITGAFPPLVDHVPVLYNADRSYLINLLLYGLQGEIQVLGETYNGVMPAWQQLSDDDIANVLNYVTNTWGNADALQNFQPYEAGEIASARDAGLSAADVYELRQQLELTGSD